MMNKHHVVVIGGGFGGLCATRSLRRAPVRVTLVDRRNHHLFQPLLYQVATGGLSPANIAAPLRALVKKQKNAEVRLGEVAGFDLAEQRVYLRDGSSLLYDTLVVATGAGQSYFGNDAWKDLAPGLKSLEDATRIRRRVLLAFEQAELENDPDRIRDLLTFVVVGAGPTGVELAGALAEISHRTLQGEFRQVDPADARVVLVEGADRVLRAFDPRLSDRARASLEKLGVEVRTGWLVRRIEEGEVEIALATPPPDPETETETEAGAETENADTANAEAATNGAVTNGAVTNEASTNEPTQEVLNTRNVFWAAGVEASPLGRDLARLSNCGLDPTGRVIVQPDCSLRGRPNVFVIGDLANYAHGHDQPLPGLAPVAMQQGRYVAKVIRRRFDGLTTPPFTYLDKGNMATIGRKHAVGEFRKLRFWGLPAWLAWLFVHLMYLAEFQNRVLVLVQWGWNYFTRNRSARLITAEPQTQSEVDEEVWELLAKKRGSKG